ncbi:hypothetical protein Mapa_006992 [Marchantia paleacea]|nr:hypothetical protein Mapa_006992 [Marchantia paleacea]
MDISRQQSFPLILLNRRMQQNLMIKMTRTKLEIETFSPTYPLQECGQPPMMKTGQAAKDGFLLLMDIGAKARTC